MITPQELRIGNYFQESTSKEIIQVESILIDKVGFSGYFTEAWQAVPIELTEAWLLKFGFVKKADHNFALKVFTRSIIHAYTYGKVEIELGNMSGYSFGYPKIDYVHQLQNLFFSLCGEELKIKE
ncbi:hypothetical protein [Chryseobacterium sp. M5A1_1a]